MVFSSPSAFTETRSYPSRPMYYPAFSPYQSLNQNWIFLWRTETVWTDGQLASAASVPWLLFTEKQISHGVRSHWVEQHLTAKWRLLWRMTLCTAIALKASHIIMLVICLPSDISPKFTEIVRGAPICTPLRQMVTSLTVLSLPEKYVSLSLRTTAPTEILLRAHPRFII